MLGFRALDAKVDATSSYLRGKSLDLVAAHDKFLEERHIPCNGYHLQVTLTYVK